MNLDNSLNSVPDQIDPFISSDTEPEGNAYKNIKCQKIKDILLKDIKKDVCDFIQNEIRQKINLYSQDEHRTLDKRIIANLEKEIHFLKTEIETKDEIIKNFIKNDSHRNENNNVPQDGQIWESNEHEYERSESDLMCTSDRYAAYDTRISSDSNINEINTANRNIDEQLKAIREKNTEYLQNTSRKSPSQENIVIETNEKNDRDKTNEQPNDTHDNTKVKSEQDKRGNQFRWPSRTCEIAGDSMINGIDEKRLSQKFGNVKVFYFLDARIEDLNHYIVPIIKNKPDYLILHVGTNHATTNSSRKVVDDLLMLKTNISKQLPNCRIVLSKLKIRHDHGKANLTIRNVNKHLENLELECIDNSNINAEHLGQKRLHLDPKGKGRLALNFLKVLKVGRTRK